MACPEFINFYNGQKMPALGFGTWRSKDNDCEIALEEALRAGYRHIDTAFAYENEHIVGKVVNKWISEGKLKREELFITTKLHACALHKDRVEEFCKKSLENLNLEYIDLYLVHCPVGIDLEAFKSTGKWVMDTTTNLEEVWKKMEEQVTAGRVKSIGVSNFNIKQIQRILNVSKIKPANLQVEVHLYMQQRDLVDFCKKNGVTVVAYCPLGNPGFNNFLVAIGKEAKELPNILGNPTVTKIAAKHKKTPAQIALKHLLQRGISAIPKSVSPNRIRENINLFDFTLDGEDMAALNSLEVGPGARICDFKVFEGFEAHPEFPF